MEAATHIFIYFQASFAQTCCIKAHSQGVLVFMLMDIESKGNMQEQEKVVN